MSLSCHQRSADTQLRRKPFVVQRSAMSRFPLLGSCVLLLFIIMVVHADMDGQADRKPRKKREWVIPPPLLYENRDYTKRSFIAKVRSDKEAETEQMLYYLHGPGADQPPTNVFVVDQLSGFVRITKILDREIADNYTLYASARFARNLSLAEDHLTIKIVVTDVNDNAPVFHKSGLPAGTVHEKSPKGTFVTRVHATDADDANTPHATLRYKIIKQEPKTQEMMFYIEPKTGEIKVNKVTLDRETQSTYVLTVKATDMAGLPSGFTATGTVSVRILDINDNRPVLTNATYSGIVEENTANVEVLRFKATDRDEKGTANWQAKYKIISGNENGFFSIKSDAKTNEGALMLNKPVDYENMKELNLEVAVDNEAPYEFTYGTKASEEGEGEGEGERGGKGEGEGGGLGEGKSIGRGRGGSIKYPVNIKVKNLPDGPKFVPEIKPITISEDKDKISVPMVLTAYPAVDEDSGEIAKNVRYAKTSDPAGWLAVDSETGEIKLTRVPDRESKHVVDGRYYAKVLCMTENLPFKTATGTVELHIEDVNDHCPTLTSNNQNVCIEDTVVYVTAHDKDGMNSLPFTFQLLEEGTEGSWDMKTFNDTTVTLTAEDFLEPRDYAVAFEVKDDLGHACSEPLVLELKACTCVMSQTCREGRTAALKDSRKGTLGGAAIGILAGAFLLLLRAKSLTHHP